MIYGGLWSVIKPIKSRVSGVLEFIRVYGSLQRGV